MTFLDFAVAALFLTSWAALWWCARPVRLPRVRLSSPAPRAVLPSSARCSWPAASGGCPTTAESRGFVVSAPAAPWRTAP